MAIQLYLTKQETSPDIMGVQILKANWLEKIKEKKQAHKNFIRLLFKW